MISIRWKLMLAALAVALVPLFVLNRYTIDSFDRFTRKALEEEMATQALMLGRHYKTMVLMAGKDDRQAAEREFASILREYSDQAQSRLQILSPGGIVLFDSDPDSMEGADLSGRGEIANAIGGGRYKANWSLTKDRKYVFYYVPLPIWHDGRVAGIAYVTHHTGQITKAIKRMIINQRVAVLSAVAFAALISLVLAHTMTLRLRRLTAATRAYATGKAPLDLNTAGRDEIGELGRSVTHMASEIEKRNNYNREFVATVLHELRAPVTAIRGAAEVLECGAAEKPDARTKFLANIRYESDRLTRMVGELKELTRLDAETSLARKDCVEYCSCVRAMLDRLIPTFDRSHASFHASIPDTKIHVMIMPGRIEQVISNLLENAFRYTPPSGEVILKIEAGPDDTVLTSVRDTGIGITPENLARVFDRFFTTEPRGMRLEYGTGLGLAVAKSIVENHQGKVAVESRPCQGSCFTFSLPVLK